MKFCFFLLFIASTCFMVSCRGEGDNSILGTWKADKVHVEFDESKSTPELVNQLGEIEKQNVLQFYDSSFSITNAGNTERFAYSLEKNGDIIYREAGADKNTAKFGVFKDNLILTESSSLVGKINITYVKTKDN